MATCKIQDKYEWMKCDLIQLESEPENLCILHSRQNDKNIRTFELTIFLKLQNEDYDFQGVYFPDSLKLPGKSFNKPVNFSRAIFSKEVNFIQAKFTDIVNFSDAKFIDNVDFSRVIFEKNADFRSASFSSEVWFSGDSFLSIVYFSGANFSNDAHFELSCINKNIFFTSINLPIKGNIRQRFQANVGNITFGTQGMLRFHDVSLSNIIFSGTDLRHIDFRNVIWHSYSKWLFRKDVKWLLIRQAVYDELLLEEKEPSLFDRVKSNLINLAVFWKWPYRKIIKPDKGDYARVEELYRYLRINFEINGDFKNAGDFHYGEMEMHRRASPWRRWVPVSWYNLYRCLSGYGERPLWALIWLIVFIFGFSGLVWQLGLAINNYGNWAGFWDSFIYILQKSTLQRPDWPKPYTFGGRFWSSLSVFLIPGQAALFLLALRNRLGRRR